MSKHLVQIILPVAFAAVLASALFSFSIMSGSGHMMAGCFGSAPGGSCSMLSPIKHFEAHLNTFHTISTGIVQLFSLFAALFVALLAVAVLKTRSGNDEQDIFFLKWRDGLIVWERLKFAQWLSLHEKRDPSFASAVNG